MMPEPIPLSRPWLGEREHRAVREVLDSGRLACGPLADQFAEQVASLAGKRHGVPVSNGTAGLELCLEVLGAPAGRVQMSAFGFIATAAAAVRTRGMRVLFGDCDPDGRWEPDLGVAAAITVDMWGCRVQYEPTPDSRPQQWWLHDACESIGVPAPPLCSAAVYSCYANKQVCCGEGGVVVTDDPGAAAEVRALSNHGRYRVDGRHEALAARIGTNRRMTELQAALGLAQLQRLPERTAIMQRWADSYDERLGLTSHWSRPSPFVYVVEVPDARGVSAKLLGADIQTGWYFPALLDHPAVGGGDASAYPNAQRLGQRCLALPFFPQMTRAQMQRVCNTLLRVIDAANDPDTGPAE